MARVHTHVHLEPVYVVGTHEEFIDALGKKLTDLVDDAPGGARFKVNQITHTLAFDADGRAHWSALFNAEITVRDDD